MTHNMDIELTDEQLAEAVGGTSGYIRVKKLNSGLTDDGGDDEAAALSKTGTGTLVLTSANTYDGTAQVRSAGIIAI